MTERPTLQARPGFRWELVNWGGPDEPRTQVCSYCGDAFPDFWTDFVPLILSRADGWVAEFCDHCQAAWFGIETFPDPANDDEPEDNGFEDGELEELRRQVEEDASKLLPRLVDALDEASDTPSLGPCCMCETLAGVRNIIMLDRRCVVAGHGWGCVVCGLPSDGACAVLCDACALLYLAGETPLTIACRGYPATDGRVAIAVLPPFEHDITKHAEADGDG